MSYVKIVTFQRRKRKSHALKTGSWTFFRLLSKILDKHPCPFYKEVFTTGPSPQSLWDKACIPRQSPYPETKHVSRAGKIVPSCPLGQPITPTGQDLGPSLDFFPKFSTCILVLFIRKFFPQAPLPRACMYLMVRNRAFKIYHF